jgi:hypothetical protein
MNTPQPWREELRALCEAAIEDRLQPDQAARLEQLVLAHPEARRFYVEYLYLPAGLTWSAANPEVGSPVSPPVGPLRPRRRWPWAAAALAAAVLLAVGGWLWLRQTGEGATGPIATLAEVKACKWDGGTLPTEAGARLTAGRLRLAEGVARITFDQGADVTIEGPADLVLVNPQRCVLHAGRLVARVPPPAQGFVVETPTAVLTDHGTEFGVHVKDRQTADVQVFDGRVDGQHRASGQTQQMLTGRNLRFGADGVAEFDPAAEKPPANDGPAPADGVRVVHVSTATGRGKDGYVQPLFPTKHSSDILLLVKNTVPDRSDYFRKAYIGLDLGPLRGEQILDAQVSLTFTPTGMGFASEVPDATFTVYGLTDESLDGWDERALRWQNAPANRPGGAELDPERVVRLGSFEIQQGVASGTRSVSGPALVDFLKRDTNGLVTLILVRDTPGSGRNDLVHGFANKQHPSLPPPTLKLTVAPRKPRGEP